MAINYPPNHEIYSLESAAKAGDHGAFLLQLSAINWRGRPPGEFVRVIQLALDVGLRLEARQLAAKGVAWHPDHKELQKYARVLAPPRVVRSGLPPDPTLKANSDWLVANRARYSGQWVAIRNGELLGAAASADELTQQIGNKTGALLTVVHF